MTSESRAEFDVLCASIRELGAPFWEARRSLLDWAARESDGEYGSRMAEVSGFLREHFAEEIEAERLSADGDGATAAVEPANPASGPLVVSFAEFASETFEAADSLWGDAFLVRGGGYLLLGGEGGVGKTVLLANLAIRMAAAEPEFLGFRLPGRSVPVLFLEAEGSRARFRDWVVRIARCAGYDPCSLPIHFRRRDSPLDLGTSLRRMVGACAAEFVVLDPIGGFFTGNENDTSEWRNGVTRPLRVLGEELGFAAAFSDHFTKPHETRTGRHKIRGSAAKVQDCGAAMRLEIGSGGKGSRVLFVDRVRDGEEPDPDHRALSIDLKTGTLDIDAREGAGIVRDFRDPRIEGVGEILSGLGEQVRTKSLLAAIQLRYGLEQSRAEDLLRAAKTATPPVVESIGRGYYRLPGGIR